MTLLNAGVLALAVKNFWLATVNLKYQKTTIEITQDLKENKLGQEPGGAQIRPAGAIS